MFKKRRIVSFNKHSKLKQFDIVDEFDEMGLKENVLRGLYAFGFEKPSAIQKRAILPILNGRDVIAQAQSGTGKSSLIAITSCQKINSQENSLQILILSPTREL